MGALGWPESVRVCLCFWAAGLSFEVRRQRMISAGHAHPNPSRPGGAGKRGLRYPGRRLEDSPLPWAIISSSFQDFRVRWRVGYGFMTFGVVSLTKKDSIDRSARREREFWSSHARARSVNAIRG